MLPPSLIEHLSSRRDAITKSWLRTIRTRAEFSTPELTPTPQLLDHLPHLYDDLTNYLREEAQSEVETHARTHGHHRWEQRFRLEELLRELLVLRKLVIAEVEDYVAREHTGDPCLSREARRRVVAFFDEAILYSAGQFSKEQQAQIEEDRRALSAAHQSTNAELKAVDAARLRMLRVISHELRNLLNAANLTAQSVFSEEDPEWRAELQDMLRRNHAQMTALVNQLLDVAPLLAGRDQVRLAPLDLGSFAAEQYRQFNHMAEAKRLGFRCDYAEGLPEVVTDEIKLQRVVTNLVQNALKYTPSGGAISLHFETTGVDRWRFSVTDTGPGIPAEHQAKIFDEFHRVPGSEQKEGTGLGLSIVRQLVTLMGGEIHVESELGRGSSFWVELPCDPRQVSS